jgi:hypothetical protein
MGLKAAGLVSQPLTLILSPLAGSGGASALYSRASPLAIAA